MVTQKAHCNRGTFYYHYESLDALLCTVIEEELLNSKGLPLGIFYMLSNDSKALTEMLLPQRTQRFGLVMKRCGQECVALKIRTIIANMWQTIEYSISGLIGVIDYLYREGKLDGSSFPEEMIYAIKDNAHYLAIRISNAQGISLQEFEQRVRLYSHIAK